MSSSDEDDCRKSTKFVSSNKDKGVQCQMCHINFKDFNTIIDHHCMPYECKVCSKKFEYNYQLNFHACNNSEDINKIKSNKFQCTYCNLTFVTSSLFELHEDSCSAKNKICSKCEVVSSSPNKPCECKAPNIKKRHNGAYLSCNGDAFCEETSLTESGKDILSNDDNDKLTDINSEIKLNGIIMDSKEIKSSVDCQSKITHYPSNLNSNKRDSSKPRKANLLFSGKFKKSSARISKAWDNSAKNCRKSSDETVKKCKPKTKNLSAVKKKAQTAIVLDEEMSNITTESSNTTVSIDNTVPECDMPSNEKVSAEEMIAERSDFKEAASLQIVLSPVQLHKYADINLLKDNVVENCEKHPQKVVSIMEKNPVKLKGKLESTSNTAFNGVHSSHSAVKKTKRKKQTSASSKSSRKRKADVAAHNVTIDSESLEKGQTDLSRESSRESPPLKRKIRKSRSSSREHDSGHESCESLSSSMSANSVTSKIKKSTRSRKTSSTDSEIGNSVQESNSSQQKHTKDDARKKSSVNDSNISLVKTSQHLPLELEVSESLLNDIPDDNDSQKVSHSGQKEKFYVKEKKYMVKKVKTENNIELGDLLTTLPEGSGILLRASPGSFHNFRCPKCNKLFKHLKTGSSHLITCRVKFRKSVLIAFNEIIYVCTACHYTSTRKFELANHKISCNQSLVPDYLYNYGRSSEQFICPRCSFSCLSIQMYKTHPCTQRLEYMKTCIVNVKKIDPHQLQLSDGVSLLLDPIKYETPDGTYMPQTSAVKAQIFTGVGNAFSQKGKKFFVKNAEKCKTVEDIMKNVIKPVSQLNAALGKKSSCPDLDLDITLPYESQKLLAKAAEKYLSENKSNTDKEIFKVVTPFDDDNDNDSNDSNPDPQVQKLVAQLHNYKCKCKKPDFNADIENKPCIPCLNDFVKKHVLTSSDLNPIMHPSETSTCAASASEIDNNVQATASSSTAAAAAIANLSSNNIPTNVSSNIPLLDNTGSIPENDILPSISSVASTSSPSIDITSIPSEEMLLKTVLGVITGKHPYISEPPATESDATLCKTFEYMKDYAKYCDNVSDNETSSGNEDSIDVPNSQQQCTNSEANKSFDTNSELNESPPCMQPELDLPVPSTQRGIQANSRSSGLTVQKGEFTLTYLNAECIVSSYELKMTVKAFRGLLSDFNDKEFQNNLIELLNSLKQTISEFPNTSFEQALEIIKKYELDYVDIEYNSVHLYIHDLHDESIDYSAHIMKASGKYICSHCEGNLSPSHLIKHIIDEHGKKNIYISIIN